jgi:hypothetical protein
MPPAVGQFSQDAGGRALVERPFGFVHNGGGGRSDACDVLQKEVSRTAIFGNAQEVEEEPAAFSVKPGAAACKGQVLAWEAANDAIHRSTPGASVEGAYVGPDRRVIQCAVFHARRQDAGGIRLPLQVTDGASLDAQVGEPGSQSDAEHSDAGKQFDGV